MFHRRVEYLCINTTRDPTLNGSSGLQWFKCDNMVEICNEIMFNFYPGLPHMLVGVLNHPWNAILTKVSVHCNCPCIRVHTLVFQLPSSHLTPPPSLPSSLSHFTPLPHSPPSLPSFPPFPLISSLSPITRIAVKKPTKPPLPKPDSSTGSGSPSHTRRHQPAAPSSTTYVPNTLMFTYTSILAVSIFTSFITKFKPHPNIFPSQSSMSLLIGSLLHYQL